MKKHTDMPNGVMQSKWRRTLILLAAVITAIVVAVACALVFDTAKPISVDEVGQNEVRESTSYTDKTGNLTAVNAIVKGDILNYTYKGSVVSVTLPTGIYTLEIWGAQGGTCSHGTSTNNQGGYTKATYTITATSATIYICVGGQPSKGVITGGYNGGGNGGPNRSVDQSGGGGATHIATRTGVLKDLVNYKSNILMVAGGGGGNACSSIGGKGGGSSGTVGTGSYAGGQPGTATAAGSPQTNTVIGGFGYGGSAKTGLSGYGSGGGGGGYYGGSAGYCRSGGGGAGGGGSGWYSTSTYGITGGSTTQGGNTGNGKARITVVQVNVAPTSKNATISGTYYRGANTINIAANTIGTDPDYANASLSSSQVYFTNGTSSNYDTLPGTNAGLYLNSACTTLATNYLEWQWTATNNLRITKIKKYPRTGTDGCTLNGRLTLYTKIRDAYGAATTRGVAVAMFYLTVGDRAITPKDSLASGTNVLYRYGTSNSTDAALNYQDTSNASLIYNPYGTGRKTIFFPKPISPTDTTSFIINASDIYTDADTTTYDYVAINSVEDKTGTSAYYSVSYTPNSAYAAGLYPSIAIKATGLRPTTATYARLTVTAQSSEIVSKATIGSANTEVDIVFRIANTRPYFAYTDDSNNSLNTEPLITLSPGGTGQISIDQLVYDIDDGNTLMSTFAMGSANLKVPTGEYLQVDETGKIIALKSNSNYNVSGNAVVSGDNGTVKTGEGSELTGFRTDAVALAGSAGVSAASVTYTYLDNKTIQFTARAATQYMYKQTNRLGDFYVLVRVVDPSDASDEGMWYPIAIRVQSSKPTETPTVANVSLGFDYTAGTADSIINGSLSEGSDAKINAINSVILTPMSYVANGQVVGLGNTTAEDRLDPSIVPFATDVDTVLYSGKSVLGQESKVLLNDAALIYEAYVNGATKFTSAVDTLNTDTFFTVEPVDLYISKNYFDETGEKRLLADNLAVKGTGTAADFYVFKGIKITPLRSTSSEYFRIDVTVKEINGDGVNDTNGQTNTVRILVNVQNRAISARRSSYEDSLNGTVTPLVSHYPINPSSNGTYLYNRNIGALAVNYEIERNDVLQITPYDFVYDLDMDRANDTLNANGVLNTNPSDSGFSSAAALITKKYDVKHYASPAANEETDSITAQQLSFVNGSALETTVKNQYGNYILLSVEDSCTSLYGLSYDIPVIKITGNTRTTSAIVQMRFTVTDGYSTLDVLITVTVNNAAPTLNSALDSHYSLAVNRYSANGTKVAETMEFSASAIAYDKDGDTPTFIPGTIRVVAKIGDNYYAKLDANFNGISDTNTTTAVAYNMSDYLTATLTKNGRGDDVIYLTALSSTQLFNFPIYLEFGVQDGYRAAPQTATLHLPVEVLNSDPALVTDSLVQGEDDEYSWIIQYENEAEKYQKRYIANSKAVYDVLPGSAANKIYLFDEPDAQQTVLLNPKEDGGDLVQTISADATNESIKALLTTSGTTGAKAAVLHSPAYPTDTVGKEYLNVKIVYYDYDNSGVLKQVNNGTGKYWAIEISDSRSDKPDEKVHMVFAVQDDHNKQGTMLYTLTDGILGGNATTSTSNCTLYNFYYQYQAPNITAMHEYYRTDGNKESTTYVDETLTGSALTADTNYLVSIGASGKNDGVQDHHFADGSKVSSQSALATATFAEDFQYQYFVKTVTRQGRDDGGEESISEATYKHFPASAEAFKYQPVSVGGSNVATTVTVPMSYIAMPSGGTQATELGTHVTLANATTGALGGSNVLRDDAYLSWGSESTLQYVLDNVTLSDTLGNSWGYGTGKPLSDNDYLDIGYAANEYYLDSDLYLNKHRKVLTKTSSSDAISMSDVAFTYTADDVANLGSSSIKAGMSIFREDKYGFTFSQKSGGYRAPGLLTFTVAVKTTAANSDIEFISMNIKLENSKPTIEYNYPGDSERTTIDGMITDLDVNMTTSDVNGKTVMLVDTRSISNDTSSASVYSADYIIYYTDNDYTDVMKFKMSSAIGVDGMTDSEYAHLITAYNTFGQGSARSKYFGIDSNDEKPDNFEPNPGYSEFFDVSPADGVSTSLQFIPNAKTQLNIPDGISATERAKILEKYHLEEIEINGEKKIYYPFRVIFYDEVSGSTFTDGSWALAIIRVFIDNDPVAVNSDVVKSRYSNINSSASNELRSLPYYEFSLSKNTNFFVDVSSLLIDNDIPIIDGSLITAYPSGSEDFYKYTKDYLLMPDSFTVVKPTNASLSSLPVDVYMSAADKNGINVEVSDTTIVFKANSAYRGTVDYLFTFNDSVNNSAAAQKMIFSISYENEKPSPNASTFGGSDTLTIKMTTGQSFTLAVADADEFATDVNGGFANYGAVCSGYAYKDAATLAQNFGTADSSGFLGVLIVGSDDAASTLRFSSAHDRVNFINPLTGLASPNDYSKFDYSDNNIFAREDNANAKLPMSVTFKALGVVNTMLSVTMVDGMGETTTVKLNLVVESTPPQANTNVKPTANNGQLTYKNTTTEDGVTVTTYSAKLSYNGTAEILLSDLMTDIDAGDSGSFTVYKNPDGSMFDIINPDGVSAVDVKQSDNVAKSVILTATDFIPTKGEVTTVSFRVCDAWGVVSDEIVIELTIEPRQVESLAQTSARSTSVKSYSDYLADSAAYTLDIVTSDRNNKTALFYDPDADAESATYDIAVYGLYDYIGSGRFERISTDDFKSKSESAKESYLIGNTSAQSTLIGNTVSTNVNHRSGSSDVTNVCGYLSRYFIIEIADNGKTLSFTPISVTLSANQNSIDLEELSLYIEISKRSIDKSVASDNKNVSVSNAQALLNVSVQNSKVVAVENSPFNAGYPKVSTTTVNDRGEASTTEIFRDSEFLSFTGTTGDSLTWKLFAPVSSVQSNSVERDRGLFYDYDMINYNSDSTFVSREALDYNSDYVIRGVNEAVSLGTPILSVSYDDNTNDLTIKINRKVYTGQPPKDGYDNSYTEIYVDIYCGDTLAKRSGNKNNYAVNTITVRVENGIPEIKSSDDFTAEEQKPDYTITYSEAEGYVLEKSIERGQSLKLNIADIIKDADIAMDEYVLIESNNPEYSLMGNDGYLLGSSSVNGTNDGIGRLVNGSETLFSISLTTSNNAYKISTLSAITFTCESTLRGAVGVCELRFRDSVKTAKTSVLTVRLTVDNIRPDVKPGANLNITVMGSGKDATEEDIANNISTFNIVDYITDENGDNYLASEYHTTEGVQVRKPTYTFIDEIIVYTTDESDPSLRPSIYGPLKDGDGDSAPAIYVCSADWAEEDVHHQTFRVIPKAGVYGVQKISLKISDSGFVLGSQDGVLDGKTFELVLTITVANPLEDVGDLDAQSIGYGITRTILVEALLGEENAQGYEIASIVEDGTNNLTIYAPGTSGGVSASAASSALATDNWRIYAKTENTTSNVKVTFRAGNVTTTPRNMEVKVTPNNEPVYKGDKVTYEYTLSKLDDPYNRTLKIYPEAWFEDMDEDDIMSFVDPVVSSQSVIVSAILDYDDVADGGRAYILLTFNRRGESEITLNVSDLSGRLYSKTITVNCTDAPEMSWWENVVSLIEAHWMWFWIIVACILLFLILLILLIIIICKKRKTRREIEALLESETELEEEMMRLNAAGMAQYQSFGYLPPTQQTVADTSFMIGGGQSAPMQDSLQLNAGTGATPTQTVQINSVPGNRPPVNSMPGTARPSMSVPGNTAQRRPVPPQQPNQRVTPPTGNDGFNPDDF